jgi:hypothetical protein
MTSFEYLAILVSVVMGLAIAYPMLVGGWLLIAGVGFSTSKRKVHAVLVVAWPILTLAYIGQALNVLWGR